MNRSLKFCLLLITLSLISSIAFAEINQPQYTATLNLNPENRSVQADVTVKWLNDSGFDLDKLGLQLWYDGFSKNDFTYLEINGVEREIKEYTSLNRNDDYYEIYYMIRDENVFKAGEEIELRYKYTLDKVGDSYDFIHYTGNWIPTLMPILDGKPTLFRDQWAKYDVTVTYPNDWQSCSTGQLKEEKREGDLVEQRFYAKEVTNFAVLLFKDFIHLETESAGIKINSYYREGDEWCGNFLLERAMEVIEFYVDEFGHYPQPIVNILPGANRPMGGYPVAANCLVVHRGLDESRADFTHWILAHELGHEYWGYGNVLEDLTGCRWFGLSMGIYTDWIYSKHAGLPTWLHERFESTYISGVFAGYNTDISQSMPELYSQEEMDWNNIVAHGKSFTVLKTLQSYVSEETFRDIHRYFLEEYPGKTVTMKEFQTVCERLSGKNMGQFFQQWYKSNDALDYRIGKTKKWKEGETWITEVEILKLGDMVMPVDVSLCWEEDTIAKTIDGWSENEYVRFETINAGGEISLDPSEKLPLLIRYLENYETVVGTGARLVNSGDLIEAKRMLNRALGLTTQPIPRHYYFMAKERLLRGDYKRVFPYLNQLFEMEEGESLEFYKGHGNIIGGKANDLLGFRDKAIEFYNRAKKYEASIETAEGFLKKPYEIR